jgi:hypothetical protein
MRPSAHSGSGAFLQEAAKYDHAVILSLGLGKFDVDFLANLDF